MKRVLATMLFLGLTASLGLAKTGSWHGWVSDAKCGAKVNADCAKKCADAGEKLVFVNSDKAVIPVTNPEVLKGHEGHHVMVKGNLDNGMLTVSSVKMMKDQEPPK
ncbi:MAG TPA: hypothetical protein VLT16_01495 [Candidatus Limnocylindrales bacterium]|nr:hypothetical protein [Candidatus Limnocylindrales bacterium]